MACVKVYLCSNPEESVVERRLLRGKTFPELREYCRRTYGVDFRVIDPYEPTDPTNWPSQQRRMQMLDNCRRNSLGPFFVGLVGEQYGDACLPQQIEASEFQCLLQACQSMNLKSEILERCYQRDENVIPPSFCLVLNPAGCTKPHTILTKNPIEEKTCSEILCELRKILQDVVTQCVQEDTMTHDAAQKYFRSALENDIQYAHEDRSDNNKARCLCYVHKISIRRKARGFSSKDPAQSDRLSQLRDHFLPSLVASHKALVYTTTTECSDQDGYTHEMRLNFAVGLREQLQVDLKHLIDDAFSKEKMVSNFLGDECAQKDLRCIFSSFYRIDRPEVKHVKSYLEEKNTTFPFVLTGRECSGKSVLLAHCASQASMWLEHLDPVIIVNFIDISSSLRQLLKDISQQIEPSNSVNNVLQLKENFNRLLTTSSFRNPLVLMIDGLDQLPNTAEPLDFKWLPKFLPPNVKVLMSITTDRPDIISTLKTYCQDTALFCELQPVEGKSCNQLLTTLLQASNRKITSGQQMYVNQALKECPLPLYVHLLHKQASLWRSDLEVTKNSLVQGVRNNIELMFDHLEWKHGNTIVSKVLSYLTLARYGLSPAELTDVLSCDDEVLASFLPSDDCIPLMLRVPEVLVETLLLDLEEFLVLRNILGTQVLFWISGHFPWIVRKRYLCSEDTCESIHHVLACYFSGSWANGTAKRLIVNDDSETPSSDFYIDRQAPSQPWKSTPMSMSEKIRANRRKLLELPFHLLKSGRINELGNQMTCQEYLQATFHAMLSDDLFLWLEKASQLETHRNLKLLNIILRSSYCLVNDNPADLPTVLQAKLFPFLSVLPSLEDCVHQGRSDGVIVKNEVYTVLSSVPSIPYTHHTLQESEAFQVTHTAGSDGGSVVVVLENGAAWVYSEGLFEGFKLLQSSDLQFTSVRSSGSTFLLTSHCGKLVLWDVNVDTQPQEVRIHEKGKNVILAGALVFEEKLISWWKRENIVSVFVKREKHTQLHCTDEITCVSCSEDGNIVYCGQKKSSVMIFDLPNNKVLATFICPEEMPIIDMVLSKDEGIMTCVDEAGNVFVWNLEIISEPVLIKLLTCRTKGKVLNTDHTKENLLLICKKQQIEFIDIDQMEVLDQFNPPKGKTIKQAIMDEDSHFIIALVDNCPFLLVWNRVTGQCVSSLDTVTCQANKLLKCGATHLAAITNASVLIWNMDLITASALAPKSGRRVETVLVGLHGESCYSADGSELVWKWVVSSGRVEEHFLHHGSVQSMSISADGDYLVTIATGDIYVWNTNSGENMYRIAGSRAVNILITSKGYSGVALSDKGPSRVWKLLSGKVVCSIHTDLKNAIISPESTFLLGQNRGDLLAMSLWSGNVCKRFWCPDESDVNAFHPLPDHPDFVVVVSASGALYTWRLTEDTVCHQLQLPNSLMCQPEVFRLSSDGGYAILSVAASTINILDLSNSKLCSLRTIGPLQKPLYVGVSGQYVVYVCYSSQECQNAYCDLHEKPMLVVICMTDGEIVGRFYLCKNISALTVSEHLFVYVGFEDGSVGIYAVNERWKRFGQSPELLCPLDKPLVRSPLVNPNITWVDLASKFF
ncbi:NACHT and WD repeat domain-containing protein 2 isoform X2 [Triplophysa rosa]|uniref:NACHT and WD repeat domain-containing protein 2 isoform X2 n=1 Tax=Triplophysa rosa TaxID=992332 RepID=UPI0025462EFC|nr:NACHT and WD repeat domain-containing protein 2 isoform X2 [Triplophysa rosa]